MNEATLTKLVEKSRKYVDSLPYGVDRENEHIWKLSELIVQECADFLKDVLDDHFAAEQLVEHFGVEE